MVWDGDISGANATYHNDVFGLGRDDANGLFQTMSKSVNSTSLVRFADASINDGNFLIAGNDTGTTTYTIPYAANYGPIGAYNRMQRVWKVQETNDLGPVEVCTTIQGSHILVNPSDNTFAPATTTETALVADGNGNYCATVDLTNG